jgi:hypothetical protein
MRQQDETSKESNIRAIERDGLLSFWRDVSVYSLMKAWSAITCWSRHWIFELLNSESDLIVDLSFFTSFRKSYLFHSLNLGACSSLIEWNRTDTVERWTDSDKILTYCDKRLTYCDKRVLSNHYSSPEPSGIEMNAAMSAIWWDHL